MKRVLNNNNNSRLYKRPRNNHNNRTISNNIVNSYRHLSPYQLDNEINKLLMVIKRLNLPKDPFVKHLNSLKYLKNKKYLINNFKQKALNMNNVQYNRVLNNLYPYMNNSQRNKFSMGTF